MKKIIDISLPLSNQTPVYPGNVPVSISVHQQIPESSSASSSITFGSHTGTHIDAPSHVFLGGQKSDEVSLQNLVGPCRVLDFSDESSPEITKKFLEYYEIQKGERILLKTKNSLRGFTEFYDDYVYLGGEAAEYLASLDVLLVGIDALSIKQKGSKDHRPHTALLSKNIPILEGVNLNEVRPGEYKLFCLPLKLIGIDGAPARVILIEQD